MAKSAIIRIMNTGKQLLQLQVRPPNGDFYQDEQQIRMLPGHIVELPKSHLLEDQIQNLQRRGELKVVFDSEYVEHFADNI